MSWGLPSRARASAWLSISAQVFGGLGTRSLRYHSSWVLLLNGAATSCPFQVAVSRAALTASCSTWRRRSPVQGTIQPASENSASQTTSRPRMSSELSLAALRRTSCWRWSSAAVGSVWIAMLYSPPEAAEQSLAAAVKLPEYSGKMYQFSVGVPPVLCALAPPQAASIVAAAASTSPRRQVRRRRILAPSVAVQ